MSFELQPNLNGALVHLRPLTEGDFDALFAVAADPVIWEQHPTSDRYMVDVFRGFFADAMASRGALLALDAITGEVMGSSRYNGYDEELREIEIGWTFLAVKYWGGAYNGEMKHLMLRHAFRFVDRVLFLVGPSNIRSQRAVEKIGGVRRGERTDATGRTSVVFALAADAFATGASEPR
ncbi:MAG: GNAT family N-acetyltransferase [bacterium]